MDIIALIKAERDKVERQLNGLNAALAAFAGTYKTGSSRPRRKMSAAARETNSLLLCAPCRQMSINLFI